MSNGSGFFAISDDQLKRLLGGELPYGPFLQAGGGEKPRETNEQAIQCWYELSQVLQAEAACGVEQTDKIPSMVGFAYAKDVQAIAAKLKALAEPEVRKRCEGALMEASVDEVVQAVRGLTAFYERAASNQDAVLFRVA